MATMQVAPHQSQPPVGPGSYTVDPSPSSRRQYQQSPPASEHARSPSNNKGSPHSSRRPSRRPSGNTSQPGTSDGHQAVSGPNTPRVPDIPATHASPVAPMTASSPSYDPQRSRREQRSQNAQAGGPPFSPPPRTSSTQRNQAGGLPANAPLADRTTRQPDPQSYDDRPSSSRRVKHEPPNTMSSPSGSGQPETSSQSRRRGPTSPQGPQRATSTRDSSAQQATHIGQSRHTYSSAAPPPSSRSKHEDGQIINRLVVDDPIVDLQRENERQVESVPGMSLTNDAPVASSSSATPRRQDFSAQNASSSGKRKETRFGEYMLGQTLGEGEFGKVKLGWKTDGSVQVAIKLIRRESLGTNPSRLPKIEREIKILKTLQHPNIVRLHEMVETSQHIGMVLEYASGGELFDHILNHRYLKDGRARKLFAQLVSGVGYLHKKGIVHRDLKLENLLLDRNQNIIITDFGFANTFDPRDELGEEIEYHLTDRDFVKKMDLERIRNGSRRGDLMATSCGSPCYAAPELVVTDSLYTGRKVDVWSCGVILYAMLAGYLPFDDDPENPDGDNINQLYKYITTTPLTFPEYVTPHARDLLRRILVADPRKRADLFEVARHSWLSEFSHVVAQVTSSTTSLGEIAGTTVTADTRDAPGLVRSHSVREPAKATPASASPVGGLSHQGKIDPSQKSERTEPPRDSKRRTVQVEYVAPQRQTARGEPMPTLNSPDTEDVRNVAPGPSQGRARAGTEGPADSSRPYPPTAKPLPQDPRQRSDKTYTQPSVNRSSQRPAGTQHDMAPPQRPPKDFPRSVSDSTSAFGQAPTSTGRPTTGGSMASTQGRLPSRGNSYSQPLAPTVAAANAQGRVTQPKSENRYNISSPMPIPQPQEQSEFAPRPITQHYGSPPPTGQSQPRAHKRSNTLGNFFRTGSISGPPRSQPQSPAEAPQREAHKEKRYPPTSMKNPMPAESSPRQSMESRRPSFSFTRKSRENSDTSKQEKSRRFSLLPASFSLKSFTSAGNGKDGSSEYRPASERRQQNPRDQMPSSRGQSRPQTMNYQKGQTGGFDFRQNAEDGDFDGQRDDMREPSAPRSRGNDYTSRGNQSQQTPYGGSRYQRREEDYPSRKRQPPGQSYRETPNDSELSIPNQQYQPVYPPGFGSEEQVAEPPRKSSQQSRPTRGPAVLAKNNRRFADAYNQDQEPGSGSGHHAGSSGAAKRVMDFFRRRGKARSGDDRDG